MLMDCPLEKLCRQTPTYREACAGRLWKSLMAVRIIQRDGTTKGRFYKMVYKLVTEIFWNRYQFIWILIIQSS